MYSGIVETIGTIKDIEQYSKNKQLTINCPGYLDDLFIGDSIAINGTCVTITELSKDCFQCTIVPETQNLTNLKNLQINDAVNIERCISLNQRIGGHLMQGHIDTTAEVLKRKEFDKNTLELTFIIKPELMKYIIYKGFIGIDGMSITVSTVGNTWFSVNLIPHTVTHTISQYYQAGSMVNIEIDMTARYIENLLKDKIHA